MAITTAVYKKNISNVGVWSGSDVINQLEDAFTGLGWHSQDDQGGYIVGLSTWLGGGTNPNETYGTLYVEGYHSGSRNWKYFKFIEILMVIFLTLLLTIVDMDILVGN